MFSAAPPEPLLTIYVLSYEAPAQLAHLLDSLLPFESGATRIIIGDNSPGSEASAVVDSRRSAFGNRISYVKHACNLGALANILRAFELAESKYVWIVGGGDQFCPGALRSVESILKSSAHPFHLFQVNEIKFGPWPAESKVYTDFLAALRELELGSLTNINSVIYEVAPARRYLPLAYQACSSLVPQTAILAASLAPPDNLALVYHPLQVFERLPRPHSWNPQELWTTLGVIYPKLVDAPQWKVARKEILKSHSPFILNTTRTMNLPVTSIFLLRTFGQFGMAALPLLFKMLFLKLERASSFYRRLYKGLQHTNDALKVRRQRLSRFFSKAGRA